MIFRSLPHFKGKTRLGRLLFKEQIKHGTDLRVKGKFDCEYILPNLKEVVALEVFLEGIYESETHDFLMKQVPENAVMLDIGANIGSVCIPLAKRRKDISFICVEASPFVFRYLGENIKLNGLEPRFTCINKAIGEKGGEILPFYSSPENFGKGSLSPVFTRESVQVQTTTINDLIKELDIARIDFIKADIEGFEYFAFNGGRTLLESNEAPPILFEFMDWAEEKANLAPGSSQRLLADLGYDLFMLQKKNHLKKTDPVHSGSIMLYAKKRLS